MTVNTGPDRGITLDNVLYTFLETVPEPDITDVTEWIRRYPQFRQELMDFAAGYVLMERLPDAHAVPVYHTMLATRGRAVVRDLLDRDRADRAADDPPPVSLSATGGQRGHTIGQLAAATGLSIPLWRLLDRRLVQRVPAGVIEIVATTLGISVAAVRNYLHQPAMLAPSALHRSATTPSLAEPQDFFDAVRQDMLLSDEQRECLLALEEPARATDSPDTI